MKIQDKKVEKYISGLPKSQREVLLKVRNLIFEVNPDVQEKLKYGCPYYLFHGELIYFSVSKEGFYMSFHNGNLLKDISNLFAKDERKQVRKIYINSSQRYSEIKEYLEDYIIRASMLNMEIGSNLTI